MFSAKQVVASRAVWVLPMDVMHKYTLSRCCFVSCTGVSRRWLSTYRHPQAATSNGIEVSAGEDQGAGQHAAEEAAGGDR
eukprot:45271-Eustigmatos_ZCMA.PRE.1